MKKTAAMLLCLVLLCMTGLTAFAAEVDESSGQGTAQIEAEVPATHKLTVSGDHAGFFLDGAEITGSVDVKRLSQPVLCIRPESGYRISSVTLDGEEVVGKLQGGCLTVDGIYRDKTLAVVCTRDDAPNIPQTGDSGVAFWSIFFLAGSGMALILCRKRTVS